MWCQDFFWRWRSTYLQEAALPQPLLALDTDMGRNTADGMDEALG
jgi:hypothetical protein